MPAACCKNSEEEEKQRKKKKEKKKKNKESAVKEVANEKCKQRNRKRYFVNSHMTRHYY